ncbi:hypothetical protein [Tumebacillus amylolyticus]|nr:hypothetical protein [Tumebacillus amylolyticus]
MENALSKSFTQVEDMHMSSFLRYWYGIQQILEQRGQEEQLDFSRLLDPELLKMLEISIQMSTFEVPDVAEREIAFFQGLRAHVDGLLRRGSLSHDSEEVLAYESLMSLYSSQEEE